MVGCICIDNVTESVVITVEKHPETRCDDFHTGDYNWDKSEKTVADYDSNDEYPDTDSVVGVVYPSSVHKNNINVYHVPESRITPINDIV